MTSTPHRFVANTVIVTEDVDVIWRRILRTKNTDIVCPDRFVASLRDRREQIEDAMEHAALAEISGWLRAYKSEADEEGTRT